MVGQACMCVLGAQVGLMLSVHDQGSFDGQGIKAVLARDDRHKGPCGRSRRLLRSTAQ